MAINIISPFKTQAIKTFDESKIGRDVHAGEFFTSTDVRIYLGKVFKFGTTITVVGDDLSKPKPLKHIKTAQASSLCDGCAEIHMETQKSFISRVKSAKNNIAKLFRPASRVSEVVVCTDPFVIPRVEPDEPNHHPPIFTSPSISRDIEPEVCVATAYESILLCQNDLKAITSPTAYGEKVLNGHIEDLTSTICSHVESFPTTQISADLRPAYQPDRLPSAFLLGGLHAIEEEDGRTEVGFGVPNREQKELAMSGSCISPSDSDAGFTVYLSSETLSDYVTANGISPKINTSPVDTSFATSVDADSPGVFRGLRRVPNYEDLKNVQIIAKFGSRSSDVPCGSSDCDFEYAAAPGVDVASLRRSIKCNNLRKSFLSFEPELCPPSTRQANERKVLLTWLSRKCHAFSPYTWRTTASRTPGKPHKVLYSYQFLQGIFHPSSDIQTRVKPSPYHTSPQFPLIWSCAKITRPNSKTRKRRRMTKRSTRRLKARLDSMNVDPWY